MLKLFVGLFLALHLYGSTHIVLLGDPHLPGKNPLAKEHLLETINGWSNVDMVVALGDICSRSCTHEELTYAKRYFSKLTKPRYLINGNHDYIYEDHTEETAPLKHASYETQMQKLKHFQETFSLPKLYYSVHKEPFLLIFLSADDPKYLAQLSHEQIAWFQHELSLHPKTPTIVFFHAPLNNTLENYNKYANTPNFIAQPKEVIHEIIMHNPQLFLWVSGHTHTPLKEPSFASAINRYQHVYNLHNTDLNKESIYTHSLFLEDKKVIIKTYNHHTEEWLNAYEREVAVPKF